MGFLMMIIGALILRSTGVNFTILYTNSFPNPELTYFGQFESMQNSRGFKETFDLALILV